MPFTKSCNSLENWTRKQQFQVDLAIGRDVLPSAIPHLVCFISFLIFLGVCVDRVENKADELLKDIEQKIEAATSHRVAAEEFTKQNSIKKLTI